MTVDDVVMWGLAFGVIALVVFWERKPLSSIGVSCLTLKEGLLALLLGVALVVLILIPFKLIARFVGVSINTMTGLHQLAKLSIVRHIFLSFRAGVTEEILFRAYPMERIKSLTGKVWIGGLVTLIIFTILHIPGWG